MDGLPIIIGGFFRTGSSLLRRLLDSHSRIHCGPEVKFFEDLHGDYIDDPLKHARFFKTVASLGLSGDEILGLFGRAFVAGHELAAAKAGKPRWADKNPNNVRHLGEWEKILPDGFLFVRTDRHPLDSLASLNEAGFPKAIPAGFAEKVSLLNEFNRAGAEYVASHGETSIVVRYEDLVLDPEGTLRHLFAWLGEPYEPRVIQDFWSADRVSGIEDPKVAKRREIHGMSIGRWRNELTADQVGLAVGAMRHLDGRYDLSVPSSGG